VAKWLSNDPHGARYINMRGRQSRSGHLSCDYFLPNDFGFEVIDR
jgi:hypothetical protein